MDDPNEDIVKPGQVCFGTCGYTDQSLLRCGRFYPATAKTSQDRLKFYSNTYPCVEIDTTTYSIPTPEVTQRWATSTTLPFKLHVKAFGLFTAGSISTASLPVHVRSSLPLHLSSSSHIRESDLPKSTLDACWTAFHNCLQPLYLSEKLGIIIFQFHTTFKPSTANLNKIITIRTQRMSAKYKMAVEFRCREWFTLPEWSTRLETAFGAQGIAIISADELQHETFQKDRDQRGLPPGQVRKVLPICNIITNREWHYIRLHRRHGGTTEKSLTQEEVAAWVERLSYLAQHINGPIYFLVGTDWEDVPMKNINALNQVLPEYQRVEWKTKTIAMRRNAAGGGGGMFKYLLSNNKEGGDGGSGKRRQGIDDADDEKQQVKDTHPTSHDDVDVDDEEKRQQQKKKPKGIAQYFLGSTKR